MDLRTFVFGSCVPLLCLSAGCCKNDKAQTGVGNAGSAESATPTTVAPSPAPETSAPAITQDPVTHLDSVTPPTKPLAGFNPSTHGFSFRNYGNREKYKNLTSVEMRRLLGDGVCAEIVEGKCLLSPQAKQEMKQLNSMMGGGHCEGMAALSLLMARGQISPTRFGADSIAKLEIGGNEKLQREIAYWWTTQLTAPVPQARNVKQSPVAIAEKVAQAVRTGDESYTLAFWTREMKRGHATTPYAVVDKGDGITWIMHYDNNFPGKERHIEVNTASNTWKYSTAANPEGAEHDYEGDATSNTLRLAPTSVRTGKLECAFCGNVDEDEETGKVGSAGTSPFMREISLDGDGDLLIVDDKGKRLGFDKGKLVSEIEGAYFVAPMSMDDDVEPVYYVPTGRNLKLRLDGSSIKKDSDDSISVVGHGYTLGVEEISLSPTQVDELELLRDWREIRYTTKSKETPVVFIGVQTKGPDYLFRVKVKGQEKGQTIDLSVDTKKGQFILYVRGTESKTEYAVELVRTDAKGEQVFSHKGEAVGAAQIVTFHYGSWKGNKSPLRVTLREEKGSAEREADLEDEDD